LGRRREPIEEDANPHQPALANEPPCGLHGAKVR
jgi:hypothetical protein